MGFAGKHFLFSPPLPVPAASISVALTPIFALPKSEKCLERAESPTETLAMQGTALLRAFLVDSLVPCVQLTFAYVLFLFHPQGEVAVVVVAEVVEDMVEVVVEEEGGHLVGVVGAEEGEGAKREIEMIVLESNLTVE